MYTKEEVRDHLAAMGVINSIVTQVFEIMVENEDIKRRLDRLDDGLARWYENALENRGVD